MTAPATRSAGPRVSATPSATALVLFAAGMLAASLVAVAVASLVTVDDVVASSGRSSDSALAAVPADPAPAPMLSAAVPSVAFARDGDALPSGLLGAWDEVSGAWVSDGGVARVAEGGRAASIAVVEVPAEVGVAQVTLTRPAPGAGLVVEHGGPDDGLHLVVDSSGRAVELVRLVPGEARVVLGRATMAEPGGPVVLAVAREGDRVEAYGNGVKIISRQDPAPGGARPVGLVAGPGRAGETARFDDLVVR